jgi:hypothetical protein
MRLRLKHQKTKTPPAPEVAGGVLLGFTLCKGAALVRQPQRGHFVPERSNFEHANRFVPPVPPRNAGPDSLMQSQNRNSREIPERSINAEVLAPYHLWRSAMTKLGIVGVTALSLSLAIAAPAFAAGRGGGGGHGGGMGGGAHFGGGMGGSHFAGTSAAASFRGANAMAPSATTSAVRGNNFAGNNFAGRGTAQFAQGGRGFRGDHGRRGYGGYGFAAGLAAGSALGYGYGGYYGPDYYDGYYGDDYAYGPNYYDGGYPADGYVVSGGVDPSYCAQRYKSYDPASGTYLGYDGMRHPCGQ